MSDAESTASQADASTEVTTTEGAEAAAAKGSQGNEQSSQAAKPDERQERNWREMRRSRDELLAENARIKYQLELIEKQRTPSNNTGNEGKLKTLADFEFDESRYQAYLFENVSKTAGEKALESARAAIEEERQQQAKRQREASYRDREKAFAKDNAGYFEAVQNPDFVQSDEVLNEIFESEEGPAIALYLAKNLDVLDRLNELPERAVAREIARIESRIKFEREKATSRNAIGAGAVPAPAPSLDGTGSAPVEDDPDNLPIDKWMERENKRIAKRRSARH